MPGNYHNAPNNFEFRRRSQRVFVDRPTGDVILRLHETDIVRVSPRGDVTLSTGGWATNKTLYSMNDALELFGMEVTALGNIPNGNWSVTDSDGAQHSYANNKVRYVTTIRSKGPDDRQRAQWLAEAYKVPYSPPAAAAAAPSGPRIAAASAPAPAGAGAARPTTNGVGAPASSAAAAPAARPPGVGSSWANVAGNRNQGSTTTTGPPAASAAAHPARMTGPGAAASARPTRSGPPGFSAGASSTTTTSSAPAAAAGRAPAAGSVGARPQQQQHRAAPASPEAPATVTSVPPMPVGAQLVQQMQRLGIGPTELEDDAHLCVVCMEEPRSIVLVPCGHMALCGDCCQNIIVKQQGTCPMCCQDVEYHVEVDQ